MSDWEVVAPSQTPASYSPNMQRFLDFISKSEGHDYNTIVGGSTFSDFSKHPGIVGVRTVDGPSTAAGRYGITQTTYNDVAPKLGISDFSKGSQDAIAVELIRRGNALQDVESGDFKAAINKLGGRWASFPSSTSKQPKRGWDFVEKTLNAAVPSAHANDGWEVVKPAAQKAVVADDGWEVVSPAPLPAAQPPAGSPAGGAGNPMDTPKEAPKAPRKLTEDTAAKDPQWVANAKTLYQEFEKKPFKGSDQEASDWLNGKMSWYNNNLASLGKSALDVTKFSDTGKKAFLGAIEDYDSMPTTLNAFGRGVVANLADPTNYLGLGIGSAITKTAGKAAAKEGAKLAIQQALEKNLGARVANALTGQTAKVAAGGAAYTGGRDLLEQQAKVNAGGQEEVDYGKVGGSAGMGAAGGAVVSKAINRLMGRNALEKFAKRASNEENLGRDVNTVERIQDIYNNPIRDVNGQTKPLMAKELNARVTGSFPDEAKKIIDNLPADDPQRKLLSESLDNWYKVATDKNTRSQLGKTKEGQAVLDIIDQAYRADVVTAPKPARGGLFGTAARTAVDAAPASISAATGLPVFLPASLLAGIKGKLGGRKAREEVSSELNQTGVNTLNMVREVLGKPTAYESGLDTIQKYGAKAQNAAQARAQVQAQQAAKTQADKITTLQTQREPMGGAWTYLLSNTADGNRQNGAQLGLSAEQLIKGLRKIAKDDKGTPIGEAAKIVRGSRGSGTVDSTPGFNGLQTRLRQLRDAGELGQPAGVLSGGSGALTSATNTAGNIAQDITSAASAVVRGLDDAAVTSMVGRTTDTGGNAIKSGRQYLTKRIATVLQDRKLGRQLAPEDEALLKQLGL